LIDERNRSIDVTDILEQVRLAAAKRLLFLPHTIRQMSRPDRMITTKDVEQAIFTGDVIEDYPEDTRGHSCLILGYGQDHRPIHVVCAPKDEYLAVITTYIPNLTQWTPDFRQRI
jgi:Domain of unknown function (DUF4258)